MLANYQRKLVHLTNGVRASHGAGAVTLSAHLGEIARRHNNDIAYNLRTLSHVSSDGSRLSTRLKSAGYKFRYASENIARGQRTCSWVMNSWMHSPGHRRNILNPRAREMGVHVGVRDGVIWWTVVFGG